MSSGTILVADDDAAIRTVLNQALSRAGYEVRVTSNAGTLWRWVSAGEGDIVITDVVMPDENAFDLLPRMKKARPELPVIVMTVFIVNLRQLLYSANLMHHVGRWPQWQRAVLAFFLTDETFAVVSDRLNRHPEAPGLRWFYLGSALFMYSFWQISTALGYTLGSRIPGLADWGLDVAMVVAFIGIVVPALRRRADWACAAVALVSAVLTHAWPHQTGLLFSSLLAVAVGMALSRGPAHG